MTPQEIQRLKSVIALTAAYYGRDLSDPLLAMYIADLDDLPLPKILEAYRVYRKNPKNRLMPLPANIREMIDGPEISDEQLAIESAARIITAVTKFGWNNPSAAEKYIGEIGWAVVEKQGGWESICENLRADQIGIFQAQARELAKAQISLARTGKINDPPLFPKGLSKLELSSIKEPMPTNVQVIIEGLKKM